MARLAWFVLTVVVLVLWGLGTAVLVGEPLPDCAEVSCDPVDFNAADLELARELGLPTGVLGGPMPAFTAALPGLLFFAIAGVIFWRRSDDWMALLVSFTLVYIAGLLFTSSDDAVDRTYPALVPVMSAVNSISFVPLTALFFLFPDGRFVPRWTVWVAGSGLAALFLLALLPVDFAEIVYIFTFAALLGTGVYSQFYRYRRVSDALQRQQTKWVVFGGLMSVIAIMVVWSIVASLFPPEEPTASRIYALLVVGPVLIVLLFLIPVSFAVSILRYRLWDIDLLINRTLVYGSLTATLATAYFGSVVLLQMAFRGFTGQESTVALVVSTLVIAGLFQPARRRIQRLIDRRFYRRKYDAAQTISAFSEVARDEVDLERLSNAIVRVVDETIQPSRVSLWLRETPRSPPGS